jgi:hypothetical protein
MKTLGAELFHADRQTDRRTHIPDEANIRFSQICKLVQRRNNLSLIIMIERQLSYDMAFPFLRLGIIRNVTTFVVLGS